MTSSEQHLDPLDPPPTIPAAASFQDGPPAPFPCPADADVYAAQALALLPPGPAWPRGAESVIARLAASLAQPFRRVHERFCALLAEATPITTDALLADWERVLGLPDPCAPAAQTVAERRVRVLQRLAAIGGQSRAYYIEIARALGYQIEIEEFRPFLAGIGRAGDPLYGISWRYAWRVVAPETTRRYFRSGEGRAGEPLSGWGNDILECVIRRLAPAHTVVLFAYRPTAQP
jgi:uncharacterized protein YmfQ (DUF2313 family)